MIISCEIYGKRVDCELINELPLGTIEVMRLSDGKCFRLSGLVLLSDCDGRQTWG